MKTNNIFWPLMLTAIFCNAQWTKTSNGQPPNATAMGIAAHGTTLFAAAFEGMYASDNNGATWTKKDLHDNKERPSLQTICAAGDSLLAGGSDFIYVSADQGRTWKPSDRTPKGAYFEKIFSRGYDLYVGCFEGLYYSFNRGIYWDEITGGIKRDSYLDDDGETVTTKSVRAFIIEDKTIYTGTSSGVFKSSDRGKSWEEKNQGLPKKRNVILLEKIDGNFFCSTAEGLYVSADKGQSWKKSDAGLPKGVQLNAIVSSGTYLFLSLWQKGIFISRDGGNTWTPFVDGLEKKVNARSLFVYNNKLYAGIFENGIWTFDLSKVTGG